MLKGLLTPASRPNGNLIFQLGPSRMSPWLQVWWLSGSGPCRPAGEIRALVESGQLGAAVQVSRATLSVAPDWM
jgi:hypothetical protein